MIAMLGAGLLYHATGSADPTGWLGLGLLGVFHGINPAMGWLFAVARGLQERRRGALLRSVLPIAIGHEASVAAVLAVTVATGLVGGDEAVRILAGLVLVAFGSYKLARPRHPGWVGIRISERELVVWSFLMATAHGSGLMLLPIVTGTAAGGGTHVADLIGELRGDLAYGVAAATLHTVSMLASMSLVAIVVHEWLGVGFLRRGWLNVDRAWAAALVVGGSLTLLT